MKKYLFVDDDAAFLKVLGLFFGSSPHVYSSDVFQIASVLQHKGPFNVMITDYDMPYYNGVALAQWVNRSYPKMPIFILSGHEKPEVLPPFITKWMQKPVSMDVLAKEIELCPVIP